MSRPRVALTVSIAIVIIVGIIVWKKRPLSIEERARICAYAFWNGDTDLVYTYATKVEKDHGLTANALHQIWERFIEPKTRLYRIVGDSISPGGGQGICHLSLVRRSDGTPWPNDFAFVLWETDLGPRDNVANVVIWAWIDPAATSKDPTQGQDELIRGVKRDRPFLESIGVKGLAFMDPFGEKNIIWEDWDKFAQRGAGRSMEKGAGGVLAESEVKERHYLASSVSGFASV